MDILEQRACDEFADEDADCVHEASNEEVDGTEAVI